MATLLNITTGAVATPRRELREHDPRRVRDCTFCTLSSP
jgi:hypothetical protein